MSIPLYIDVNTGEGRVSLAGPIRGRMKLFLDDLVPLAVAFIRNGQLVTSTVLESGDAGLKVGIRSKPGLGSILAVATSYTLNGQEAEIILPLNDAGLKAHLNALPQSEAEYRLEVEVTNQAETTRVTYYQSPCIIGKEVNIAPPP